MAWWLRCLHCRLTARRSWVRFPHGALLALGGRSSPECTVLRWAISRAFLCGVCMFSPCSQGVSSTKNPNRKNMQNNRTHVHPWPKMDSSLHLVPGRYKLPTAPGGSLRKDGPGWEKAENKFTATSGLPACVCVCVLCRLHICTCVFQCVVCAIKNLTKVLIIIIIISLIRPSLA